MKTIMVLLALPAICWGADENPSVTVKAKELFQSEFTFDPAKVRVDESFLDSDVVTLPTLTVSASVQHRQLERVVHEQEKQIESKKYSVVRGGTIFEREVGPAKIELGTWSIGPGLGLLKISW